MISGKYPAQDNEVIIVDFSVMGLHSVTLWLALLSDSHSEICFNTDEY